MAGLLNWLSQIASVTKFGLMGITQRRGSVAAAVVGIAGVVTVLIAVLSIAVGFQQALSLSGAPDTAIVLRSGSTTEMVSGFGRDETRIIADAPGVVESREGMLASPELFVIINLPKRSSGTDANVPLRGVEKPAFAVHNIKMESGRAFEWGRNEVIVGAGAALEFSGLEVGNKIKVGRNEWTVVGTFSAGGGTAESEIWTDATVLQGAYNRGNSFQSVHARLASPNFFDKFKDALTTDPRLNVKVMRQPEYYAEQSTALTTLITVLGNLIGTLMGVGAVFGALNTMYNSVSTRTREIATLRALGFGSGAVVVSVMLEALVIALAGGALGATLAYLACNGFHTATVNWQSFSQVTFSLQVTPELIGKGILWATVIGLVGGLLPAIRAARLPIAAALREL